jgi:hypothetical protein
MRLLVLLVATAVAACAPSWSQNYDRALTQLTQCRTAYEAGRIATRKEAVECSTPKIRQELAGSGYPHMDLVEVWIAYTTAIAERVDRKEMSDSDANLLESQMFASLNDNASQRMYQQASMQASRLSAASQFLQAQSAWQRAYAPRTAPVTCTTFGNVVSCR